MSTAPTIPVSIEDVRDAMVRIAPHVHRTPVMRSATLDRLSGLTLFFKCENLQRVGAFKIRGAMNAVMRLPDDVARRGVVTHSSGNHAQALALAASLRGIPATIVMPVNAPEVKRRAVIDYGASVIDCEPTQASRESTVKRVQESTGATLIPPFDHPDVIAGQGAMALELLEQVQSGETFPPSQNDSDAGVPLDAIIVPIGGGGMIAGVTIAAKALQPGIQIIGAEPLGADDAARSKASGVWQPQENPQTMADGLRTSTGSLTWPVIRDHVDRVITVDENAIINAMLLVMERMKLVIEPSAAVGVAVALDRAGMAETGAKRVAVILCGGNVDLTSLPFA